MPLSPYNVCMHYFFFALFVFCSLCAKPLQVEVHAKAALLLNVDSGAILFEKDTHQVRFPASITKIATALYALEKLDPTRVVTVSAESVKKKPSRKDWSTLPAYWLEDEGTNIGLVKGEQLTVDALLHGLLLASGNDAANVLAETASGSISSFVNELNAYLSDIGCTQTHFCAPHGLHHPEHYTTAHDMGLIAVRALRNEKMRAVMSRQYYGEWKQTNRLLQPGPFFYSKAIGMKTGYTAQAGYNLVSAAQYEGRTLVGVVLGCEKTEERYLDMIALFEAAFAEQKVHRVLFTGTEVYSQEVEGGRQPLTAALTKEVAIDYYPAEEPIIRAEIHWKVPPLPIVKGMQVGEMRVYNASNVLLSSTPMCAADDVHRTWSFFLKNLFQ
jgi:serine-type D-Ala-D-Ala carboxypeptidase (penicillin-binding protein 5/6)